MRIQVQLPRIQPEKYEDKRCPYCESEQVKAHGQPGYRKPIRDVHHVFSAEEAALCRDSADCYNRFSV